MANLNNGFNSDDFEPLDVYEPIPVGEYIAMIVDSERVKTKNGNGEQIKLTWQIVDGEYDGRKVFDRLNLDNPNTTAVEMSMRQLSSICHATGKHRIADSAELHNIPCLIGVEIRSATPQYAASNRIRRYNLIDDTIAPASVPTTAPATQVRTTTAPAKKPWQKS